jgi:N-acetyl-alpha-D-glucosaminyl L-malate synthase BshA
MNKEHFRMAIAPLGEKILVQTCIFRKVKRMEDVFNFFASVIKQIPAKLLLVGDGPERPRLERLCREMGIYEHVRFLGKQDAIEEILAVADLFIIPSENESFGLAALEAMACEVPVISSNAGGLPEVNIDGVTGFLSEIGDVKSMAVNAMRLLQDPDMLTRFRKNALAQAHRFDISFILPKYEAYYEKVLTQFNATPKPEVEMINS